MDRIFTEAELAATGIASRAKLRADRMKGTGIEFFYVGNSPRYTESAVKAYIEKHKATRALAHPERRVKRGPTPPSAA